MDSILLGLLTVFPACATVAYSRKQISHPAQLSQTVQLSLAYVVSNHSAQGTQTSLSCNSLRSSS
ncbi:hypothetical protein F511_40740 [Dorcoceras hygrometricum]|uniref:Uncharacterized protein n=1 Tax=Dorcoceras hygrometricum TaxID=472368 RepID=A0A2Z7A0L1_9LAMI|nr:hypothetical protein F511_40740 [Dorcoceras hygrometricum]